MIRSWFSESQSSEFAWLISFGQITSPSEGSPVPPALVLAVVAVLVVPPAPTLEAVSVALPVVAVPVPPLLVDPTSPSLVA